MVVVKCAWCGAVVETKDDGTAEIHEINNSLCPVCEVRVENEEETDFIIPVEDTDSDSQ
jgi:endogenous inhibitor of DNA gyrase (YacG/DUF329 family)